MKILLIRITANKYGYLLLINVNFLKSLNDQNTLKKIPNYKLFKSN